MSENLEDKLKKIADKLCTPKNEILYNVTLEEVNSYLNESAKQGYELCKKEYEKKLRWIPIYEPPKTAELVIVDSGENLHACVAVAFFENGIWKYANGQTLWFTPRRWRRFL